MSTTIDQINWMHWIYRLIAYIIDCIVIGIPAYIIYYLAVLPLVTPSYVIYGATVYGGAPWWGFLLLPFILGILQLLYFMVLDTVWGGTIGKRILGLQVQNVNGGRIQISKSFIRNISKIYGLLLLLDWLVGIITPGDKNQKFTDRIATTTVVQTKQAFISDMPPPPPPPPT